jgi:hypothetical protein
MTATPSDELDGWDWPAQRRETLLVEHRCPHGIGHPNPGSALWLAEATMQSRDGEPVPLEDREANYMVHGCDGCCRHPSFPGYRDSLAHAHKLIRDGFEQRARLVAAAAKVVDRLDEGFTPTVEAMTALRSELGWPEPDADRLELLSQPAGEVSTEGIEP